MSSRGRAPRAAPPPTLASAVAAAALCAVLVATLSGRPAQSSYHRAHAAPTRPQLTVHGPRFVAQRPAPRAHVPISSLDQEIARLGLQSPAHFDRVRDAWRQADDLYLFMSNLLPEADSGERAAQFYVYLAVGQCQAYLRLDADEARALNERMLLQLNDRPVEERRQWENEYERCRGFAGADLTALKAAMGDELPGGENEYASIFYQRAANAGYPPALAEGALRISTLDADTRMQMLQEAVASGDPEVYWTLFFHSPVADNAVIGTRGMAWLLAACRAGYDCSSNADWFRGNACLQDDDECTRDESAVEHYWYRLSAPEREQAWALADRIAADRAAGRYDAMPWPSLSARNIVDREFGRAGAD